MPYKASIRATWKCVDCGAQLGNAVSRRCRSCANVVQNALRPKTTYDRWIARFWSKVDTSSECWIWTGTLSGEYGCMRKLGNRQVSAHRISWELTNGPVPDGMNVLHNCPAGDNPACINPKHLWLGTLGDNNRDRARKGRNGYYGSPGEKHPCAKLTENDVREIRRLYRKWSKSSLELAARFGVGQSVIYAVVTRKTWKHVI